MLLETKNAHPRDSRIIFHEEEHVYEVDAVFYKISVSGIVHTFFPQFDAKQVLDNCYEAWLANKKSRYFPLIQYIKNVVGITDVEGIKGEIARSWSANGKDKSSYGTALHRVIELYLNEEPIGDDPPPEFAQFLEWRNLHPTWVPYRTEWSIFDEDHGVAGQIDSVWFDAQTGEYHMVDWKVVENMATKNDYNEKGYPPFDDFANTNLYHYTVQQNAYKFILATKYGMELSTIRLLQLHQTLPKAVEWELQDVQDRMLTAFNINRKH